MSTRPGLEARRAWIEDGLNSEEGQCECVPLAVFKWISLQHLGSNTGNHRNKVRVNICWERSLVGRFQETIPTTALTCVEAGQCQASPS